MEAVEDAVEKKLAWSSPGFEGRLTGICHHCRRLFVSVWYRPSMPLISCRVFDGKRSPSCVPSRHMSVKTRSRRPPVDEKTGSGDGKNLSAKEQRSIRGKEWVAVDVELGDGRWSCSTKEGGGHDVPKRWLHLKPNPLPVTCKASQLTTFCNRLPWARCRQITAIGWI